MHRSGPGNCTSRKLVRIVQGADADPVMYRRDGLDEVTLVRWKKVLRVDEETGNACYAYVGPRGQSCADLDHAAFAKYN